MLSRGLKCCIHGDGSHTRRYIHATDVANAVSLILHEGVLGQIYNIGTTFEISNLELARMLVKLMIPEATSPDDHLEFVGDRQFNDRRYAIDSLKLSKMGWTSKVDFEVGLKETSKLYSISS